MRATRRISAILCAALLGLLLATVALPGTASAHETRELAGGKYQAVVGFLDEPAVENQMNGLDLTVTSKTEQVDGKPKPIEGLEKTLQAQVIYGGGAQTMDLTVERRFGQPGKYAAHFMPTRPGDYTFRVYGEIEGQRIDERFSSSPTTFSSVEPLAELQFPQQVSVPADLQSRLDAAETWANTAQWLGIGGLVVGLLGLGTAAYALMRRPAAGTAAAPARTRLGEGD